MAWFWARLKGEGLTGCIREAPLDVAPKEVLEADWTGQDVPALIIGLERLHCVHFKPSDPSKNPALMI